MAKFSFLSAMAVLVVAKKVSWCVAIFLAMLLLLGCCEPTEGEWPSWRHHRMNNRPCDEIYVVGEGETLQTVSDKCGDPYILEENTHIQDTDDMFPGLVIKITPFNVK